MQQGSDFDEAIDSALESAGTAIAPTPVPTATPVQVTVTVTCIVESSGSTTQTVTEITLVGIVGQEVCTTGAPTSISVAVGQDKPLQLKQGTGPSARYRDLVGKVELHNTPYFIRLKPD